ncbi:MAG: Holliday junction branch migration protein RuvA [Candidatus Zambryskibacteria bacterium]|nr:Holliday junction branch migration protein RuvA [Candidatus Zambryskibacteria bacterium]
MIGYLKGTLLHQDLKSVILDVGGVGYKIYTNTAFLSLPKLGLGDKSYKAQASTAFWTYLAVRETALDLYGFNTKDELHFFELLISVSGIGPKSAMGILSIASVQNLRHAIVSGDTSHLTKVSGIGKKNAEKIVIELKDKLEGLSTDMTESMHGDVDAIEALKALGYGEREAREALKKAEGETTEKKVRSALKKLS